MSVMLLIYWLPLPLSIRENETITLTKLTHGLLKETF